MTATRPDHEPLEGRLVRLEPLTARHAPELWTAIGRPEVFAGGYGGGPAGLVSERDFPAWLDGYYGGADRQNPDRLNYVVRLAAGPDTGALVGATTLGDLHERNESAHLGWTAYDPRVWGTGVNPECKLLLLARAFDHGYGRVKLQADALNSRSRAAILKLGARFEGVVRRERPRPDGSWRDTAVYSILAEEWPEVRAGLESRLASASAPVTL